MPGSSSRSANRSDLAALVARPAQERAHAGEQLLERERLRDVVVRARVEAGDPVFDLGARGQHQHRERATGAAQAAADLETVHAGHEHVEDHRVGLVARLEAGERLVAVRGELDLVPLELEGAPQGVADRPFIIDD